jgi:site-specific recombinase XerD
LITPISTPSEEVKLPPRRAVFVSYPVVTGEAALVPVAEHGRLDRHPAAVYLASLSPGSRRTMRGALRTIAMILSGVSDELRIPWQLVDYAHATLVRTKLAERLAPATTNRVLAALKGTLKCAFKLGLISADHYTRASMIEPVRGSRLPAGRDVSGGEVRALFEVCDPSTPGGARNAALLAILFGAGLRRSELVALDVESFDPETGGLVILGKGNRTRKGWVTNGSRDALDAWLTFRGTEPGPLFLPVRRGGRIESRRMSDGAVAELVHRLGVKARIPTLAPHDARRTFVGSLLSLGADLSTVQQLAGHASPATTSRYDRRSDQTRRKAVELLHVPFVKR